MATDAATYCRVLMRCPECGHECYRQPTFRAVDQPLYKGHQERVPEPCPMSHYFDDVSKKRWCSGASMETVPGFNHDLTLHGFDVDMETITDGKVQGTQRISSLHEVRAIEKLSLKKHANGEGQPLVFRDLSQDRANRGVNTLTGTPYEKHRSLPKEQVFKQAATHAGPIEVKRVTADKVGT